MPSGDGAPSNPTNGTPYHAAVDIDNANQPLLHPSSTNRPDINRDTNNEDDDVTSETFQDETSMKLENRDEGDLGRGRGNGGRGGRGGRLNWHEQGNYANEDEKDYNEDVFTVELIEHAGIYRAVNEPSTDDDDDFASLHEEDEWEMVSHELLFSTASYHASAECGSLTTTPFLSTRWENGNDFKEYEEDGYLPNLLYVPTLRKTLLSISRITRHSDEAANQSKPQNNHMQGRREWKDGIQQRTKERRSTPPQDWDSLHTDLWGPAKTKSPNGSDYCIAFSEGATN
ncbi:hypothetical protein H257_08857 [Aphanomyces astaci]|uniref:Uncharacterized protein n=1 Tax=Aphanomyces astaci TaxID=112090 RepID=W4GCP1_APHAT|nr:hypothetical protein H257_08857 [Aphanomyces astaci]ETV77440.1 hypothetical protein H257_08857 [Aphanomyces astaci]|eukprot:XP_009833227.1 hypothetical protein H257_08857 [Aphanomyces astaci]